MEEIEKQLKKQAQILGDLNLELNKYVQDNQKVSLEIMKLEERISKKKKIIQQEGKDKTIIHEKLVKAEHKKQKLEIEMGDLSHKQQRTDAPTPQAQIKRPESLNKVMKKQQKQEEQDQTQKNTLNYVNSLKGQYEPPVLLVPFGEGSQSNSEQQENEEHDDEKLLESVRKKLEDLKNEDENNEDNNEG